MSNLISGGSAGRRRQRLATVLGCALLADASAWAQTTWTGAGTNANWSNPVNWTAGVPASNNNPTYMSDVIMLGPGTVSYTHLTLPTTPYV